MSDVNARAKATGASDSDAGIAVRTVGAAS
jgi:hypothetical protein